MFLNKPIKGTVAKIDIDIAKTGDWYIEHYKVEVNGSWHCTIGQSLFPSKGELLKSL